METCNYNITTVTQDNAITIDIIANSVTLPTGIEYYNSDNFYSVDVTNGSISKITDK